MTRTNYDLYNNAQLGRSLDTWVPNRRRISISAVPDVGGFECSGVGAFGVTPGGTSPAVVTQATDKSTTVALSVLSGQITMEATTAINAGAEATFTVTNTLVGVGDVILVNHVSGGTLGAYFAQAHSIAAGSFKITVSNLTAGNLSEGLVLAFRVIPASYLRHTVVGGSPASPQSAGDTAAGAWSTSITGTSTGNANLFATIDEVTRGAWDPWIRFTFLAGSVITSGRWWVGAFSADPSAVAGEDLGTGGALSGVCIGYDTAVDAGAFWRFETAEATTQQTTVTEIPVIAGGIYTAEFRFNYSGTTPKIDLYMAYHGLSSAAKQPAKLKLVASHATTLPASTTKLLVGGSVTALSNAARRWSLGRIDISQN